MQPTIAMPESGSPNSLLSSVSAAEQQFLVGKRERGADLESAVRIFLEFLRGSEFFGDVDRPCVTVFGSARFGEEISLLQDGAVIRQRPCESRICGDDRRRSRHHGGRQPRRQRGGRAGVWDATSFCLRSSTPTPGTDRFIELDHFFVRKVMLVKYSRAFVVMPGGFGTLDEAFEVLTLIQCHKLDGFPIVAMGSQFWNHMRNFVRGSLVTEKTISRGGFGPAARNRLGQRMRSAISTRACRGWRLQCPTLTPRALVSVTGPRSGRDSIGRRRVVLDGVLMTDLLQRGVRTCDFRTD